MGPTEWPRLIIAAVVGISAFLTMAWLTGFVFGHGLADGLIPLVHGDAHQPEQYNQQDVGGSSYYGDIPNWLQFFAATFMAIYSYYLWQLGKKQTVTLERATIISEQALEVSQQANWMRRARFETDGVMCVPPPAERPELPLFYYSFQNHGETPSLVGFVRVRFYLSDGNPPTDIDPELTDGINSATRNLISKNGVVGTEPPTNFLPCGISQPLTEADWIEIEAGRKFLIGQGWLRLNDAFDLITKMKFCYLWNPIRVGWQAAILPYYNEEIADEETMQIAADMLAQENAC